MISLSSKGDLVSEVGSATEGGDCDTFEFNNEDDIGHPGEVLEKERLVAHFRRYRRLLIVDGSNKGRGKR